ncbi:MAG: hypothetical protein R3F61_24420 [Myxococcota bacterium]
MWWMFAAASATTLAEVEAAIDEAVAAPSVESTAAAGSLANAFRRETDSDLARMLETYTLVLQYPWEGRPFSVSLYKGSIETQAPRLKKHRFTGPTVCGLRDLLHSEGLDAKAAEMEVLAKRVKVACGPRVTVAKVGLTPAADPPPGMDGVTAAYLEAFEARQALLELPPDPEVDAFAAELDARMAEASAKVGDAAGEAADAQRAHDAALAALVAGSWKLSRAACDDETAPWEKRLEPCEAWVGAHPDDPTGLLQLAQAHVFVADSQTVPAGSRDSQTAGADPAHHRAEAVRHLRTLEGHVTDAEVRATLKQMIAELEAPRP